MLTSIQLVHQPCQALLNPCAPCSASARPRTTNSSPRSPPRIGTASAGRAVGRAAGRAARRRRMGRTPLLLELPVLGRRASRASRRASSRTWVDDSDADDPDARPSTTRNPDLDGSEARRLVTTDRRDRRQRFRVLPSQGDLDTRVVSPEGSPCLERAQGGMRQRPSPYSLGNQRESARTHTHTRTHPCTRTHAQSTRTRTLLFRSPRASERAHLMLSARCHQRHTAVNGQ